EGKRKTRFKIFDLESEENYTLEEETITSHFCWLNESEIIATMFYTRQDKCSYTIFNVDTGEEEMLEHVNLHTGGQPMLNPSNEEWLVTDSRINNKRDDSVLLVNLKNNQVYQVGQFYLPLAYSGPVRCDLHPSWNSTGDAICIDIINNNKRAMAIIDV